jgi:hypothetical protein
MLVFVFLDENGRQPATSHIHNNRNHMPQTISRITIDIKHS